MDYKSPTKETYEKFPDFFDGKFEIYLNAFIGGELLEFERHLPANGRILDIGSGPGNHALRLQQNGHDVICTDISPEMIKRCKEKGLQAVVMDFERLGFAENSFDGILAYTSLLHTPKENLEQVLRHISRIMKPSGTFFLGMKQGDGEGFRYQAKFPGTKRWFSHYTDEELRKYLKLFKVEFFSQTYVSEKSTFLNYILSRRGQ